MKEDLAMNANQINLIDVAWTTGYVVGQIPSQIILTKVRPSVWIPSCELVWTVSYGGQNRLICADLLSSSRS